MSNLRRSMMMAGRGGGELPQGYTALEYVQGTGNSSILLDNNIAANDVAILDAKYDNSVSGTQIVIGTSTAAGAWFGAYSSHWGVGGGIYFSFALTQRSQFEVSLSSSGIVVSANGETIQRSGTGALGKWVIFGLGGYYSVAKIYGLTIKRNGAIIAKLLPCTDPNNARGFYDTIAQRFYIYI